MVWGSAEWEDGSTVERLGWFSCLAFVSNVRTGDWAGARPARRATPAARPVGTTYMVASASCAVSRENVSSCHAHTAHIIRVVVT